ncbi:nitrous oxide reductase accessory protein NosL [Marinococcus sp. PL1-022]|uniref:nitrous oxide reductase accessory protein NosL n=1 Tax=Marinococcus sp. PL1-022 TaxID=3095363 RepID=UPI0029C58743|nr:nitrous oxide reductase accessory protein NosL [Marinococcus sp. PL1-022]MDX6152649.1 nitrous oxide reductase accessory protein NosL [Marinococcus sp. PL1-022]
MKKAPMVLTVMASLALSACQQASHDPHGIDHDVDTCEICNMAINNTQAATQIVMEDGSAVKFDDIGCMMQYKKEQAGESESFHTEYINSYGEESWTEAEESVYVYDEDISTPMGNGVISFGSESEAEAYMESEDQGELLSYQDLSDHDWNSF